MKKLLVFPVIVVIVIIALSGMYFYASYKTRENYIYYFNNCKERVSRIGNEMNLTGLPGAKECFEAGGCFETCGSGCGLPKPTITFFEMFEFYFNQPENCLAVCMRGCLYPIG